MKQRFLFVFFIFFLVVARSIQTYGQATRYKNLDGLKPESVKTVVVKLKPASAANGRGNRDLQEVVRQTAEALKATRVKRLVPTRKSQDVNRRAASFDFGIDRMFIFSIPPTHSLESLINQITSDPAIEYVEPWVNPVQLLIPNDPLANPSLGDNGQRYLDVIRAYDAWDIETGDTSVVVAVTDSGIPLDHEDLQTNVFRNFNDPVDGIDNDGNGFIDDYAGWDAADNDNDQLPDYGEVIPGFSPGHGIAVAGISNGDVDNGLGIAGVGFNTKTLSIKNSRSSDGAITAGYESITIAAQMGADIINCSWGRKENESTGFVQAEQDIINDAVFNYDAVVIAAAGNDNDTLRFYPASYDNVLSVAATTFEDAKTSFSTFNTDVDIAAPGQEMLSTEINGNYSEVQGTSFAAPAVAGAAALLRSLRPELSAIQVMERLRVTSDDIYDIGNNMNFSEQLGKGRLNVQNALSNDDAKAVRLTEISAFGPVNDLLFYGDTIKVSISGLNVLEPVTDLNTTLGSAFEYLSFVTNQYNIGPLNELETFDGQNAFLFVLDENTPPDAEIVLRFGFNDENYTDYQYAEFNTAPSFFNLGTDSLQLTVSSNGNLGFNSDGLQDGIGMLFQGELIANHLGFLIGNAEDSVSNNVISNYTSSARDKSFATDTLLKLFPNPRADIEARSRFNDSEEENFSLELTVDQKVFSWNSDSTAKLLVFEYRITNTGEDEINGLFAGFFADWDLDNFFRNRASWNSSEGYGYVVNDQANIYAGMGLVSSQLPGYHAIDVASFDGNDSDLDGDVFTKSLKYQFLSSGLTNAEAGTEGNGNNVAALSTATLSTLSSGQSEKVAFAVFMGKSMAELNELFDHARALYSTEVENPPVTLTITACSEAEITIQPPNGSAFNFYTDPLGENLISSGINIEVSGVETDSLIYYQIISTQVPSDIFAIRITNGEQPVEFEIEPDTLFLGEGEDNNVYFSDETPGSVTWSWDFSNGFSSHAQNPVIPFNEAGNFLISLSVIDSLGCEYFGSKTLTVFERNSPPEIENQSICIKTFTSLSAENTDSINVYSDEELTNLLFSGSEFVTGTLVSDTIFYVTNVTGSIESDASIVFIDVKSPEPFFSVKQDTLDINNPRLVLLQDESGNSVSRTWMVDELEIGTNEIQPYTYPVEPFQVTLISTDDSGCTDSLMRLFIPAMSPDPVVNDLTICRGSDVTILPSNGTLFHFFDDEQGNSLIAKGNHITINGLYEADTIYVASNDSLLLSNLVPLRIEIYPLKADLLATPDTVNLSEGNLVSLTNTSIAFDNAAWVFGSLVTPNANDTTLAVYKDEIFGIRVSNNVGCVDTAFKTVPVVDITSSREVLRNNIIFYPNPAEGILNIDLPRSDLFSTLEIYSAAGELYQTNAIITENQIRVDLTGFSPGLYFVQLKGLEEVVFRLVIR